MRRCFGQWQQSVHVCDEEEAEFLYHEIVARHMYFPGVGGCGSSAGGGLAWRYCGAPEDGQTPTGASHHVHLGCGDPGGQGALWAAFDRKFTSATTRIDVAGGSTSARHAGASEDSRSTSTLSIGLVVDVGANIGLFSLYALGVLKADTVVAIEPVPDCAEALLRNGEEFYAKHPNEVGDDYVDPVAAPRTSPRPRKEGLGLGNLKVVKYLGLGLGLGKRAEREDENLNTAGSEKVRVRNELRRDAGLAGEDEHRPLLMRERLDCGLEVFSLRRLGSAGVHLGDFYFFDGAAGESTRHPTERTERNARLFRAMAAEDPEFWAETQWTAESVQDGITAGDRSDEEMENHGAGEVHGGNETRTGSAIMLKGARQASGHVDERGAVGKTNGQIGEGSHERASHVYSIPITTLTRVLADMQTHWRCSCGKTSGPCKDAVMKNTKERLVIDLVKIDVEGDELNVLEGIDFQEGRVLIKSFVIEVESRPLVEREDQNLKNLNNPHCEGAGVERLQRVVELLRRAGYAVRYRRHMVRSNEAAKDGFKMFIPAALNLWLVQATILTCSEVGIDDVDDESHQSPKNTKRRRCYKNQHKSH